VAAIPLLDDAAGQDDVAEAVVKLNLLITAFNELQAGTADQIYKKTDGTDFNFEACNSILPDTGTNNLKISVLEIGDWNMDSTSSVNVAHGIADITTIRDVSVMILNDGETAVWPLIKAVSSSDGNCIGEYQIGVTNISLSRVTSGPFDSVNYNATSFNRGFVTITYEG
jgi:hypothetical protein